MIDWLIWSGYGLSRFYCALLGANESEQLFGSKYLSVLPSEEAFSRELEARHLLDVGQERSED
ncbi:MAG: hypothetical protein K9L82_12125 [Chromatiaceae bacterium]|nr:hypothetical protein [Chromatiaceae bacterium]MCF8015610.1 hypothetical protein [Chromatiaceae bacterium]